MSRSDTQMRATGVQILIAIEKDVMDFTQKTTNQPYQITATHDATTSTLRIAKLGTGTQPNITYVYSYADLTTATLTRTETAGTTVTTTQIYNNAAAKVPKLLPFATMNENYSGSGISTENASIESCTHGHDAFGSACRNNLSQIKWVFAVASDQQIVYLSFRFENQLTGSSKTGVSRGFTKTIYLHPLV